MTCASLSSVANKKVLYLTTLGRSAQDDLALLTELKMPVKELSKTL